MRQRLSLSMVVPMRDHLIPIGPGLSMVGKTWGCNVYLLGEDKVSLIDAGFPLDTRSMRRVLRSLDPAGPRYLVATHCHLDHMGSMARLKEEFHCTVIAHQDDVAVMKAASLTPPSSWTRCAPFTTKPWGRSIPTSSSVSTARSPTGT